MDIAESRNRASCRVIPRITQKAKGFFRVNFYLLFVFLLLFAGQGYAASPQFEAISGFDLNRYLGKWYEIARMPFRFENGLVNVTATYSLRDDGMVKVVNQGFKEAEKMKHAVATGKAKFAGSSDKGHLRVSFFWIFYGDYIIIDLDPEYRCAMVASSNKYLWILSREPTLDKDILDRLITKAQKLGFDTGKLYFTPQKW